MSEFTRRLDELRSQIDEIDLHLLSLLNSRSKVVLEIQRIKREQGLPAYAPERESEIFQRLRAANEGPLVDEAVEDIFRRILQHSLFSLRQIDE